LGFVGIVGFDGFVEANSSVDDHRDRGKDDETYDCAVEAGDTIWDWHLLIDNTKNRTLFIFLLLLIYYNILSVHFLE
jgi:hypothetical protein